MKEPRLNITAYGAHAWADMRIRVLANQPQMRC